MTAKHFIFIDNTSSVQVKGLSSALDNSYINDAIVSITLKDLNGVDIEGESWPVILQYTDGSNGDYTGSFSHDISVEDGTEYIGMIVATLVDGSRGEWPEPVKALTGSRENKLNRWWPD